MLRGSSNYRSIICCGPASDLSSKPGGRRWQLLSIDGTDTWTDGRILVLLDRFMTLTIILTEVYNAHNVEEILDSMTRCENKCVTYLFYVFYFTYLIKCSFLV